MVFGHSWSTLLWHRCGKIVYRQTQMNAIALQKLTLDLAKNWMNLNFAMLAIVLKSVVTVRRN